MIVDYHIASFVIDLRDRQVVTDAETRRRLKAARPTEPRRKTRREAFKIRARELLAD